MISMHNIHTKTNPPIMMPVHAIGRPDSLRLRIWFNATIPNIKERNPSKVLRGKQINPMNGKGIQLMQKVRMVKIPSIRLVMACLLVGE